MAGPRGWKRKAIVQGAAQRATKQAAVATSASNGTSSSASVASATAPATRKTSPALQMGHKAASASKKVAEHSAAAIGEGDSVEANSAEYESTAPTSHRETTSEKSPLSHAAKLHLQPSAMASEPVASQTQIVQTAAQRVLNLPELLERILLFVTKQVKELKTVLLAQRVNKTWRLTVQTSMPLKRALWLENDDKTRIGMSDGVHWNPIIWPEPPKSGIMFLDKEWVRKKDHSEQSWSNMIMIRSNHLFARVLLGPPSSKTSDFA